MILDGSWIGPTNREVQAVWGEWLSDTWAWSHWATLTYGESVTGRAKGSATHTLIGWSRSDRDWQRWVDEWATDAGLPPDRVFWFRGREPNKVRLGTHFHALLGGLETGCGADCFDSTGKLRELCRGAGWRLWRERHGSMVKVEHYLPDKGAGYYVSKYVTKSFGEFKFSDNLNRHKIGGTEHDRWRGQHEWSG